MMLGKRSLVLFMAQIAGILSLGLSALASPHIITMTFPAARGAAVVISGSGFSTTPSSDSVFFTTSQGTVLASVTSATTSTLNLTVPGTAISGNVYVQVSGQKSNNFSFSVSNAPPVVTAGTDQTITLPASANLSGTVTDDDLPNG